MKVQALARGDQLRLLHRQRCHVRDGGKPFPARGGRRGGALRHRRRPRAGSGERAACRRRTTATLAIAGSDRLPEPAIQQREHQSRAEQSSATRLQLSRFHRIAAPGTAAGVVRLPEWRAHQRPLRRYDQLGSHSRDGDRQRANAGRRATRVRSEHARRRSVYADEEWIQVSRYAGRGLRRVFWPSRRIGPGRRQRRPLGLLW